MIVGSLCSGYGGLEMGLELAGEEVSVAWVSEIDKPAAAVLERHYPVPNLGDLTLLDSPPPVDVVCAGFPCQPVSVAGLRGGHADERWLIDDVCRVAERAQAQALFLENVPGLLSARKGESFDHVREALRVWGFRRLRWLRVRASDVGLCHRRERWFAVASRALEWDEGVVVVDDGRPGGLLPTPSASNPNDGEPLEKWEARRQRNLAKGVNGNGQGTPLGVAVRLLPTPTAGDSKASGSKGYFTGHSGTTLTDATTRGLVDWGQYAEAIARHEAVVGRLAPSPLVDDRLNPRFVEWMMGLGDGFVTDTPNPFRRQGALSRTAALRVLGNGVVPLQAATAWRALRPID